MITTGDSGIDLVLFIIGLVVTGIAITYIKETRPTVLPRGLSLTAVLLLSCACGAARPLGLPTPAAAAPEVRVRESRLLTGFASLIRPGTVHAVTIGSTIYVRPDVPPNPGFIAHELEHVAQWRAHGWLGFPILYMVAVILPGNRFEEAADSARAAVVIP